ncbi:hypothetical protein [Lentzea flava]|uniref:Uncharacterized protein n=1 Tax=Lentzea flava TaxID=103732 RepID=A0ABQ2VII6_9PSEU|nr:hypothetical protein [Lentzea flava]MCP2205467.1 hypothetical protein [Lentzea flava]GGU87464.1 hypothetical protein GCM10010178_91590 [Lentzea flava]
MSLSPRTALEALLRNHPGSLWARTRSYRTAAGAAVVVRAVAGAGVFLGHRVTIVLITGRTT